MKKINLLFLAILALFVTACSNQKEDLAIPIPSDASFVVHINLKSLIAKSELDKTKDADFAQLSSLLGGLLQDKANAQLIADYIKSPATMGLDIEEECFFYTNDKVAGLVISVNDTKKLKDALVELGISANDITKNKDIYTVLLSDEYVLAWDDHKLLALQNTTRESLSLAPLASKQLKQEKKESIIENVEFQGFLKGKKDISIFVSTLNKNNMFLGDILLAKSTDFKGASINTYISFEQGEVVSESILAFVSKEDEAKYKAAFAKMIGNIEENHLKYIGHEPDLLLATHLSGVEIYNLLSSGDAVESDEKIKSILSNFDGDISLILNKNTSVSSGYRNMPLFTCLIDVKDTKGVDQLIQELKSVMPINKVTDTSYSFTQDNVTFHLGTLDNLFYFTNRKELPDGTKEAGNFYKYTEQIKANKFVLEGKTDMLNNYVSPFVFGLSSNQFIDGMADLFANYSLTIENDSMCIIRLKLKDQTQNSLKTMWGQLNKDEYSLIKDYIR